MNASGGPDPTRTIVFLAVACFASAASLRAADPILPEIARSFGTTPGAAAYIVSFFGIAYGFAQFGYGFAGDRFGKLRVIITATFFSAATAAVCGLASSLSFLIVARAGAGVTAAAIIPLAMAWIGDAVPYDRRQTVLARFLFGAILGITLGQVFGGVIAQHFGWRWVFAMLAAIFFVAGCALAYESLTAGDRGEADTPPSESGSRAMASMLRRPWVVTVLVTVFLEGAVFLAAITFVGSDLWARFGLGFDAIGLIVAGYGVGGLLYVAAASALVRRLGEGGLVIGGGVVMALAMTTIAIAPTALIVAPAMVATGFGYYMFHNTLQVNATQMAPEARGIALGLFASCMFLGQAIGVAVAAPIFDNTGGRPIFLAAALFLVILAFVYRAQARRHA